MMVMASDPGSVMSQAEILKNNEVESLAADPDKVSDIIVYVKGLLIPIRSQTMRSHRGIDEAADYYGVSLPMMNKDSLVNIISKFRGIDVSG